MRRKILFCMYMQDKRSWTRRSGKLRGATQSSKRTGLHRITIYRRPSPTLLKTLAWLSTWMTSTEGLRGTWSFLLPTKNDYYSPSSQTNFLCSEYDVHQWMTKAPEPPSSWKSVLTTWHPSSPGSPRSPPSQDQITTRLLPWHLWSWNPLRDWFWPTWRTSQAARWIPGSSQVSECSQWGTALHPDTSWILRGERKDPVCGPQLIIQCHHPNFLTDRRQQVRSRSINSIVILVHSSSALYTDFFVVWSTIL